MTKTKMIVVLSGRIHDNCSQDMAFKKVNMSVEA